MPRGVTTFIAGVIALTLLAGAAVFLLPAEPSWLRSLPIYVMMPLPFLLAYIAHRAGGESGNPFRGLRWGPPGMFVLVWLGGVVLAAVAVVLAIGLNFAAFDAELRGFIDIARQSAEEQGEPLPSEALPGIKIVGLVTAFVSPTIAPWLVTPLMCLATFPWFGWLFRRLLPRGKVPALVLLGVLFLIAGSIGGAAENPYFGDTPILLRMLLTGVGGAVSVLALAWLFLRTGSAVIPALALASYNSSMGGFAVFLGDPHPLLAPPYGVISILVMLLAGIGLWTLRDPGGEELAVSAPHNNGGALAGTPPAAPEPAIETAAG